MNYKYKSLYEFKKFHPKEFNYLYYKGLLNKLCEDMGWELVHKKNNKWTKEICMESAFKYTNKAEWVKSDSNAHSAAKRNGWYEECTAHMIQLNNPVGYWTKERCLEDALKYKTKNEWKKNSSGAYNKSIKSGWSNECTKHMVETRNPPNYWTKERCIEEALKYNTVLEWRTTNQLTYNKSRKNGWLYECTKHMTKLKRK